MVGFQGCLLFDTSECPVKSVLCYCVSGCLDVYSWVAWLCEAVWVSLLSGCLGVRLYQGVRCLAPSSPAAAVQYQG